MSWASIAKAAPQPVVAAQGLASSTDGLRLLVVDANAIISGIKLEGIADKAVTVQEVLDEIRDKQSRQFLSSLPYHLQVSEPTEDSIKIVTRFARETGDVAALSTNDIKVLALAHTLEVAAHGSEHLAMHAAQPRMHTKPISSRQAMPGWGTVPNPEDWKAVDEANEADEAAAAAASMSRIAQQVQQLSLDPSQPNDFLQDTAAPATPPPAAAAAAGNRSSQQQQVAISSASADLADHHQQQQQQQGPSAAFSAAAADDGDEDDHDDGDVEEADNGGWEVAASSQAAARRKRRKEYKRQEKQRAFEAEWEEHARIMQQQQQGAAAGPSEQQQQQEQEQQQDGLQAAADAQAAAADSDDAGSDFSEEDAGGAEEADAEGDGATNDELLAAEHLVYTADEVGSSEGDDAGNTHSSTAAEPGSSSSRSQQQQQQQGLAPGVPGWQSSVACITADFAMQNVLLQMGLRLLTRDGRRIARLSRYALRCSACFTVTREPGRIFCPKCGNMTLDRVEVVVGSDGAEYFGVKKRHVLRGTKYSLPKPRGGRNSKDPVLREDIFLLKVKALGRRAAKKKKAPAAAAAAAGDDDAAAAAGGVDPFAPEYNQDTWHVASQAELAQHRGLAAVLQPAWKNNPNERKLTRSNRRG